MKPRQRTSVGVACTRNDQSELPTSRLYHVQPGDDLRSIAIRFYGRGDLWVFIFAANPEEIHGIRDLRPGKILAIPEIGNIRSTPWGSETFGPPAKR